MAANHALFTFLLALAFAAREHSVLSFISVPNFGPKMIALFVFVVVVFSRHAKQMGGCEFSGARDSSGIAA
jgi:hypothetical protein